MLMIEGQPLHETVRRLVLVADDEPAFQLIIAQVLAEFDLAPLTVSDGAAAIAAVVAHRNELRGAFLDIAMPSVDGIDAAHAIQQIAPELEITIMSAAYPADYAARTTHLRIAGILQKPFPLAALRALIRQALANGAASDKPVEREDIQPSSVVAASAE
jgi:DNA-binding NtrC family response regulator